MHTKGPLITEPNDRNASWRLVGPNGEGVADTGIWSLTYRDEMIANAHLLRAAYNSYDKHCGERAVEAAEADLLGQALTMLKECADELEAEIQGRAIGELPRRIKRDMETVERARNVLALAKGEK